ncbi:uncharacterized protein LOC143923200 [Arctopsyche grandis]|uniref:uncharacterized protein LOC143923200 n=1 Tax=Arctopsyche grandis TaxID=121162 RepID=UPI00406D96E5
MKGFLSLVVFVQMTTINCEFDYITCELQPNITYTNSIITSVQMEHFSLMGFNTVFAFVDSVYDFQQIRLLKTLQKRLQRSNFNNIQFVLINSYDSLNDDDGFDYMQYLTGNSMHIFQETSPDDVILYGRSVSNSVLITDRCGRISYHIIPPWSFAQFPYVKAAILSTIFDNPCGICKVDFKALTKTENLKFPKKFIKMNMNENKTTTKDNSLPNVFNNSFENDEFVESKIGILNDTENGEEAFPNTNEKYNRNSENISTEDDLPLKIILHLPHTHINSEKLSKFEYLVLKFGYPEFHSHLHPPIESLDMDLSNASLDNVKCERTNSSHEELIVYENDKNQSYNPIPELIDVSISKSDQKDIFETTVGYKTSQESSQLKILNISSDDSLNVFNDDEINYNNKSHNDLFNHYSKLLFWLNATI